MTSLKISSCYALASAAVLGIAACAGGTDGSSRFAAPTSPGFDVVVAAQTGEVCKSGPVGTYNFDLVFAGSANTGDVQESTPLALEVTDAGTPACETVFTRTQYAGGQVDPAASIQVTEQAAPGTTLTNIVTVDGAAPSSSSIPGRTATIYVNAFHSASVTFTNTAVVEHGCTYTQGWYKNHETQWPDGFDPSDTFFNSGKTWLQILKTPPKKGDAYLQLAHQYIAAVQNAAGASVPPAVQAALDAAETYFSTGTGDITGLAKILDDYNNGLTGPGHCGDEVVVS